MDVPFMQLDFNTMILSAQFWPNLKEEKLEIPENIKQHMGAYTKSYEVRVQILACSFDVLIIAPICILIFVLTESVHCRIKNTQQRVICYHGISRNTGNNVVLMKALFTIGFDWKAPAKEGCFPLVHFFP